MSKQTTEYSLLGHGAVPQDFESSSDPGHGTPPKAGAGLSHFRVRFCDEPPHVTGHVS